MPRPEPQAEPGRRVLLELMRSRSNVDWGEAPKYNEAYRKIRWPGTPSRTIYFRPVVPTDTPNRIGGEWGATSESSLMPGHVEVHEMDPDVSVTRRMRVKPAWQETINYHRRWKETRRWSKTKMRQTLLSDMAFCMSQNIPFQTKTFEYKPNDQWLYVHGARAMKYDLVTGYITHITYSGVYNKVTSLLFRLFKISIRLKGRKLVWTPDLRISRMRPRQDFVPTPYHQEVDIDLNRVYTFSDFYRDAPLYRGFVKISNSLFIEFQRTERELNGTELQSGNGPIQFTRSTGQW